jgi:hypothetical protein
MATVSKHAGAYNKNIDCVIVHLLVLPKLQCIMLHGMNYVKGQMVLL